MGKLSLSECAVVLGANGVVGQALMRKLLETKVAVTGFDLQAESHCEDLGGSYERCDATAPTSAGLSKIRAADMVLICLPEDAAIAALPTIAREAPAGALIVDTLSVKERVVAAVESLDLAQEYLSINPMFSPRIGFAGQNIAVVKVNAGPRAEEFEALIGSWGATTVDVGAEEHDKMTALIQAATHAAVLSLGLVLHEWSYDIATGVKMSTPPHRVFLALLARMSDASAEVYWDIQRSNVYARDARSSLLDSMRHLSEIVTDGEEDQFKEIMARIAGVVEPLKRELLHCADSISAASLL